MASWIGVGFIDFNFKFFFEIQVWQYTQKQSWTNHTNRLTNINDYSSLNKNSISIYPKLTQIHAS